MGRLTIIIACIIVCSCKKDAKIPVVVTPLPVSDSRTVLLKDLVAVRLPSPYFHFTYDSAKYVTDISFADSLSIYKVEYENKRVKQMINTRNSNEIIYTYAGNNVAEINEYSGLTGNRLFRYTFSYDVGGKLIQVIWHQYIDDPAGLIFKKAILTYHADENLAAIQRYSDSDGSLKWTSTSEFSAYDGKTNVDDFSLLHDFFDTFLFLPAQKLQKSNPMKQTIKGTVNDFDITYAYTYQNNLPVKKTGTMIQTRGTGTGQSTPLSATFSYY